MSVEATSLQISQCTQADFDQIITHIVEFWGSDRTLSYHHPMFLHEFGNTAFTIKDGDTVAAYLFGFYSQTEPAAYVHLVGVRGDYQRQGLARRLYEHFFEAARQHGCESIKAITTPANKGSIAFHQAMSFELIGSPNSDGIPIVQGYSGPGQDRVVFQRQFTKAS